MMTLSRSTVRIRSRITRYWLIGISSEFEELGPFAEPGLLAGRDLLLERGERVAAAGALLLRHLRDQRVEHQRGVADHGMIDAVLLVDVARRRWWNG